MATSSAGGGLKPNWRDWVQFWFSLAGISVVVAGAATAIAVAEYSPPWDSAWFICGASIGGLALLLVLLALRARGGARTRPDERRPPAGGTPDPGAQAPGTPGTIEDAEDGANVRSVLREVSADMHQADVAFTRAIERKSYAGVKEDLDLQERWERHRPVLAGLDNGDPFARARLAYSHIERARRTICGSAAKGAPEMPRSEHDLDAALQAVREAKQAVDAERAS